MPASLRHVLGDGAPVFVVGKGGVGKTTTAGALAVDLADAGTASHLISVDPAHSLHDLFELTGSDSRDVCDGRVRIEAFAAKPFADAWTARIAPDLLELIESGTYLDTDDARRFLELSLPGIDEVMAALRVLELAAGGRQLIVDTAPTGHTLRMLESARVLATWADALEAMAGKATAVASAFARGPVRLNAERLIDELHDHVRRFEEELLPRAIAIVVTRAGAVVEAETSRLLRQLTDHRLRPALLVHTGVDEDARFARLASTTPRLSVPRLAEPPRGCDGLRRWNAALRPPDGHRSTAGAAAAAARPTTSDASAEAAADGNASAVETAAAAEASATHGSAVRWLDALSLRLLFFAGKGGVGKSTCAAAAALRLAHTRPVLLYSTDPAGSLGDVLATHVGVEPVHIGERLRARQIDAATALAALRRDYEQEIEAVFDRVGATGGDATLDRRVARALWNMAPPGIDEIMALVGLLEVADGDETIVVDSAPTGHFLRLLQMPKLALDWTHAVMRALLKIGAASLDGVGERLLAFARQLKALQSALSDADRAGAIVVTLEEPMVQAETERLLTELGEAGIAVAAVVVNRAVAPAQQAAAPPPAAHVTAPVVATPPVGATALEAFLARWNVRA